MEFKHTSVLLNESVDGLKIKENGIYADGTMGGGGHSEAILRRLSERGLLIGIDRDIEALDASKRRLSAYSNVRYVHDNYKNIKQILANENIANLDGAVLDLGVSSYQLDTPERGFSYNSDAPLDMRMDDRNPFSAKDVVNGYTEEQLREVIFSYGEEKFGGKIAAEIIKAREEKPIETTGELTEIIKRAIPPAARKDGPHPAKRTFQAIRIEVNGELGAIRPAIEGAVDLLGKGGRIAIITFHSLEDRIVKQTYAELAQGCVCPREFPVCVCGRKPKLKIITKKPILPSEKELEENPRSRSAKLRVAEKI